MDRSVICLKFIYESSSPLPISNHQLHVGNLQLQLVSQVSLGDALCNSISSAMTLIGPRLSFSTLLPFIALGEALVSSPVFISIGRAGANDKVDMSWRIYLETLSDSVIFYNVISIRLLIFEILTTPPSYHTVDRVNGGQYIHPSGGCRNIFFIKIILWFSFWNKIIYSHFRRNILQIVYWNNTSTLCGVSGSTSPLKT